MVHALLAALAIAAPNITAKLDGFSQPCGSAVAGKYLYVDSYGSGVLHRVDPQARRAASSPAPARSGSRTTRRTRSCASTRRR
jgi:hypothetical protein